MSSTIVCARSILSPFFLPLNVGGNKLIKLRSKDPSFAPCTTSCQPNFYLSQYQRSTYLGIPLHNKGVVAVGRILERHQLKLLLGPLPLLTPTLHHLLAKGLPGNRAAQANLKVTLVLTSNVEATSVLLPLDIHTPKPSIGQANLLPLGVLALALALLGVGDIDGVRQRRGKGLGKLLKGKSSATDGAPVVEVGGELLTPLERAVGDELGVNAAVAGVVDILFAVSMSAVRKNKREISQNTYLVHKTIHDISRLIPPRRLDKQINSHTLRRQRQQRREGWLEVDHPAGFTLHHHQEMVLSAKAELTLTRVERKKKKP